MATADIELLGQWIHHRNADAFRELVVRHASMVYATCRRVLRNATDAEDVAQECFQTLACLSKGPEGHLGAWLHRVATNRALDRLKTDAHRREREARYATAFPESHTFAWDDLYDFVDEAIAALPDELRAPVVACYFDGQSHRKIAQSLGIPRRTVTYRIQRAIEEIRASLSARGVSVAAAALSSMLAAHAAEAAPAALVARLGRLALAGVGGAAEGRAPASATKVVGKLVMIEKLALVGSIAALATVAALYTMWRHDAVPVTASAVAAEPSAESVAAETGTAMPASDAPKVAHTASEPEPQFLALVPGTAPPTVRFDGTVLDNRGYPLGGATVRVEVTSDEMGFDLLHAYQAVTKADGTYTIEHVEPIGRATVLASSPGYIPGRRPEQLRIELDAGVRSFRMDFVLDKGRNIVSGSAVDSLRRPIAGAEVQLRYYRLKWPFGGSYFSGASKMSAVFTDSQGQFTIAIPHRAHCDFSVLKEGYGPGYFQAVGTGTDDALFVLLGGGAIAGHVLSADGAPFEGAIVTARGEAALLEEADGVMPTKVAERSTTTDAEGGYRIDGLGANFNYTVAVSAGDSLAARAKHGVTVSPEAIREHVDFRLEPMRRATIHGRVTDSGSGLPCCPIRVVASIASEAFATSAGCTPSAVTDANGDYEITVHMAREGRAELRWQYTMGGSIASAANSMGAAHMVKVFTLRPDDDITYDIAAPAPVTAPLLFTDDEGRPVANVQAALQHEGQQWGGNSRSGADGRAAYYGLEPGVEYHINAYMEIPEHIKVGESEPFAGAPGERLEEMVIVCTAKGGIEGCLVDPQGNPVADTEIGCAAVLPDGTVIEPATTMTDSYGCFTILFAFPEGVYDTIGIGYLRGTMIHRGLVSQIEVAQDTIVDLGTLSCEPVMSLEEAQAQAEAAAIEP